MQVYNSMKTIEEYCGQSPGSWKDFLNKQREVSRQLEANIKLRRCPRCGSPVDVICANGTIHYTCYAYIQNGVLKSVETTCQQVLLRRRIKQLEHTIKELQRKITL